MMTLFVLGQSMVPHDESRQQLPLLKHLFYPVIGLLSTILCQSSSVFISALVSLSALGNMNHHTAYALLVGSNIGTSSTSLYAALASRNQGLQAFFIHIYINIFGYFMFYSVYSLQSPLHLAQTLAAIKKKWLPLILISVIFVFLPLLLFGFSYLNSNVLASFCIVLVVSYFGRILYCSILSKRSPHRVRRYTEPASI